MTSVVTQPMPAGARAGAAEEQAVLKSERRVRAQRHLAYWLCAPAIIVMLAVAAYPMIYAIYLSLRRYDLRFPARAKFIGLSNYGTVLSSSVWWRAVWNTVFITLVSVAIEFVIGMALALVMHRVLFAKGAVRTSILIPYGIITVVAAISWQYAWTPHTGWINNLIIGNNSAPLTHHWASLFVIIISEVWKTTPFMALLLLAGLVLVPEDLLEAAKVDGANGWQRFTRVIVPIMKPAILVALLFRTLDAFRIFDNIFILTNGSNNTSSVSISAYKQLFLGLNLGIGSAMSVLIFLIVALIAFLFVKGFGAAAPGSVRER